MRAGQKSQVGRSGQVKQSKGILQSSRSSSVNFIVTYYRLRILLSSLPTASALSSSLSSLGVDFTGFRDAFGWAVEFQPQQDGYSACYEG